MWAIARVDLGLRDDEFGRLTLAEFDALLDRKNEHHKRACFYAGITAAAVYNANPFRAKGAKIVSPIDFMPQDDRQPERMSLVAQIQAASAALGCGPGKTRKRK